MLFKAYVLKDVAYAAKVGGGTISGYNEVNLLAPGAIAIFADGTFLADIALPGATFEDKKKVQFAIGAAGGGAILSDLIPRTLKNYTALDYDAGQTQRFFVGNDGSTGALNLPTAAQGNILSLTIKEETVGIIGPGLQEKVGRYEYVMTATDTNNTAITALIAKINADTSFPVTATVVGSQVGIQLDADDIGKIYSVAVHEALATASIIIGGVSNSLAPTPGAGTPALVAADLAYAESEFGQTQQVHLPSYYYSRTNNLDAAETYDTYVYAWSIGGDTPVKSRVTADRDMKIYMPDGATIQANFEAVMALAFGDGTADPAEMAADSAV